MSPFEEYAVLDAQIKMLTAQKEALRDRLVEVVHDKTETDYGTFSISHLKKWTYPEKVVELGEKFKAAKAKAESTGEATYEVEPSLRFTPIKL
jgi:hypothetical protein